jgi:hypothetical protein
MMDDSSVWTVNAMRERTRKNAAYVYFWRVLAVAEIEVGGDRLRRREIRDERRESGCREEGALVAAATAVRDGATVGGDGDDAEDGNEDDAMSGDALRERAVADVAFARRRPRVAEAC